MATILSFSNDSINSQTTSPLITFLLITTSQYIHINPSHVHFFCSLSREVLSELRLKQQTSTDTFSIRVIHVTFYIIYKLYNYSLCLKTLIQCRNYSVSNILYIIYTVSRLRRHVDITALITKFINES